MANEWLIVTGSLCLTLALVEAWLLVFVLMNPSSALSRVIPGTQDLIKSHIDYLLMSLFLFGFYLLFANFQSKPPSFLIVSMCIGSIGNAALFLVRAVNPSLKTDPSAKFRLAMGVSCLLTTIGYLGGAWIAAAAAITLMG